MKGPKPGGFEPGSDVGRDSGVLHPGAGQVTYRDILRGPPPRSCANDDLAEFGRLVVFPYSSRQGRLKFARDLRLTEPVANIGIGRDQRLRLDLVLAGLVGAHGGDVQAGMQPCRFQYRVAGSCGGDDKLAFSDKSRRIGHSLGRDAKRLRQIGGASTGLVHVAAMDKNPGKRPYQMRGPHLQPRLNAGADHTGRLDPCRSEVARGNGPGGGGADVRQVTVVKIKCLDQTGPG